MEFVKLLLDNPVETIFILLCAGIAISIARG